MTVVMEGYLLVQTTLVANFCCFQSGLSRNASCKVFIVRSFCAFQFWMDNVLRFSLIHTYVSVDEVVYTVFSRRGYCLELFRFALQDLLEGQNPNAVF